MSSAESHFRAAKKAKNKDDVSSDAAAQEIAGAGGATRNPNCDLPQGDISTDPFRMQGMEEWNTRMESGWWTGKAPKECPGFESGYLHALPMPDFNTCTRQDVLDYFDNGWTITEMLFESLLHDSTYTRPPWHQLRHPKAFYYCHPASLYINKLRVAGILTEPVNATFEQYFETGVDEMSWDDLSKNEVPWPEVPELRDYRVQVYKVVKDVILNHPCLDHPCTIDSPSWGVFLCLEHERIHIETSSVLIRELPIKMVKRPANWPEYHPSAFAAASHPPTSASVPQNEFVHMPRGSVVVGKPRDVPSYGWDCEYGQRTFNVPAFAASKFLISNGELWDFVSSRAYQDRQFWSQDGWQWRSFRNAKWPTWWVPHGPAGLQQYKLRTIFDIIDMPWSWPADVNQHEARAYCAWRTAKDSPANPYRLITEPEHNRIRQYESPQDMGTKVDHAMQSSGADFKAGKGEVNYNLHMAYGSECPVNTFPPTKSGCHDVFGNVWHWCEDWFSPLPGFRVHPQYDDFSAPCFDGKHAVILGGSFMSIGDEASIYARFHFRPHFFQHAGFRMVYQEEEVAQLETSCYKCPGPYSGSWRGTQSVSEIGMSDQLNGDELLSATLNLHYGTAADIMPTMHAGAEASLVEYPKALVNVINAAASQMMGDLEAGRALDVGCGPGGVSFELARTFNQVVSVEMESDVVRAAKTIQETGAVTYSVPHTVGQVSKKTINLDQSIDRSRLTFTLMDACCMPLHMGEFDVVVLSEILTFCQSPKSILGRMSGDHGLCKKGGLLIVASAEDWSETTCAKDAWLDGTELHEDFNLLHEANLPYTLMKHSRKFDLRIVNVRCWQRKI